MIKNRFTRTIKTISFALAVTVLWQSIVMAAPDIFSRDNILPRTLCFNTADKKGDFSSAMAGYITGFLSRAASVPGNRNLSDLRRVLRGELLRLTGSREIPAELKRRIPVVSGSPEEGELFLDLDGCVIRLYNHRMLDADPGFPCEVLQQICLGEYLTLQKLASLNAPSGMIARGDAAELFNAFTGQEKPMVNLGREQLRMLRMSYKAVKKRVKKAGLDRDTLRNIQDIFRKIPLKKMPEILKRIHPVVLLDEEDRTSPAGWLISFNTLPERAAEDSGVEGELFSLLRKSYPGTVALCSRALEISSTDDLLREEYFLHEMLCPYLGHERSREIQEKLYPENYDGYYGDTGAGHRDGELSLMIKQILWENCGALREEDVAGDVIHKELEDFRKSDFTSDNPSKASHFFYDHYKRWQEWNRRFVLLHFSRQRNRGKQHIRNWIEHIDLQYNYVFAKLSWLWTMETVWTKRRAFLRNESAEENIGGARRITDLNEEDVTDILPVIRELIDTHNNFMSSSRWAKHIKEDPYIKIIVDKLYQLSGQRRIPVRNEDAGSREIEVRTPAQGEGKAERRGEIIRSGGNEHLQSSSRNKDRGVKSPGPSFRQRIRLMLVNWPQLIPIAFTTAVLTLVFWALLPVNVWTVGVASVFTLGVFVYLLARNWSWGKLLFAAVFCLAAGYLLPVPWLGLSLAVTMLTMYIMQGPEPDRKSLEMARIRREGAGAEGYTAGGKTREDDREGISRKVNVEGLDLSDDLAGPFLELVSHLLGDTAGSEKAGADESKAEVEIEVDQKKFLDLAFKLAPEENIPVSADLKKQLRPYVAKKLSELENGFDFDIRNAIITLRIWREAGTHDLAEALQEVTQEVSSRVVTSDHPGESSRELEAVRELIAENYGIPEEKFEQVKEILYVQLLRDRIQQDELVGIHDPDKYYTLGRLEFRAGNMKAADTAFSLAVNFESVKEEPRAEFFMALGLISHYLDEWDQAGQSYTIALNIWEMKDEPIELDRLRKDLTEVLLEKATEHERIDGTREDGEDIGRMGKDVYVDKVESREDGYHALVKVPGKSYTVADLPLRYGHLLTRHMLEESLSLIVEGERNRQVFDAILDETGKHSFYMYFFEDDPYGLKGFAYPAEDIIALHISLRDHPVAAFHEVMEAMLRNRKGEKRQALMKLELDGEGRLVIKTRPRPSGGFRTIAGVRLSARTEEFIASEKWEDAWRKDPHYLLRVLQYELFGEHDTGLTENIRGPGSVCDLSRMPGILPVSRALRLTGADSPVSGAEQSSGTDLFRSKCDELKRNIEIFSARYADMVTRGLGMGKDEKARELRTDISFAVEEIVQNAYVHGNNLDLDLDVVLRWEKRGDSLVLEVEDQAVRGRPGAELMRAARQAGLHGQSVGLQVVSMDFRVERSGTPEGGNVYTLTKRLTGGKNIVECDMSALPSDLPAGKAYRLTGAGEVSMEDTLLNELRMAASIIKGDRSGGSFTLRCLRLGMDIVRFTGMFADMLSDRPEIRSLPADEIERLRDDITMSLDEALKNAYVHGNGMDLSLDVVLRWRLEEGVLFIEVEDHNVRVPAGSRKMAIARQTKLHGAGSGISFMKKYFNVRRSGPDPGKGKKVYILSRELDGGRSSRITGPEEADEKSTSGGLSEIPRVKDLFPADWLRFLERELSARPGGEWEIERIREGLEKISLSGNGSLFRSLEELWELLSIRKYLKDVMDKEYEERINSIVLMRTLIFSLASGREALFLRELIRELERLVSEGSRTLEMLRKELIRKPMEFIARYSSGMRMKDGVTQNTFREAPLSPGERIRRGEPVKLLFVCALNANRSFLLDIISRDIVSSRRGLEHVSIDSCGIAVPFTAHYDLAKAALDRGVPAEIAAEFRPKKISRGLLEDADHVVVADPAITQYIERHFPDHAGKLLAAADILPEMTKRLFDSAGDMELGHYMLDYLAVDEVIPPVDYYDILREGLKKELFGLREPADDPMPVEDAEPDDARGISELSRTLYGSGTGRLKEDIIRSLIAKQAGGKGSAYVKVCRRNGRPVAYIIAGNSPLDARKRLNIAQIVVDEAYKRRGLARKLFRAVYNEAREDGYDLFSVMTGSQAVTGICLAHGFTEDAATGEMVLDHSNDTAPAYVPRPGGPDRSSIVDNARYVVPRMVNALVAASRQRRKVVLALDTGLGRGDVNSFIRKLIWRLPALENNNRDLGLFLRDLEIISGPAAVLARRLDNITDAERGDVRAENVIVVTSSGEMDTFSGLDGRSVIAAVDDRYLSERAYMPYVQVLFFALGKYLGWDRERMEECYRLIPNAVPLEEMSGDDLDLLDPARRSFLIRLIPDAVKFNKEVQIEMNEDIREMLAMA